MRIIDVRNVHAALPAGLGLLQDCGIPRRSRYGDCITAPMPVTTIYRRPTERVLFWPERDANPYLHFFESLWMLAGRNDVAYPAQFAARMSTFSDDGVTLHGAYGHRWRYPVDQLDTIVSLLHKHPNTRRAVLTMWRPADDLFDEEAGHLDVPCNTQIYFWLAQGPEGDKLSMTVTCRSNDIVWGAYGANVVHFSMLQEYISARLGVAVGYYWHVSNNFHAYTATMKSVAGTTNPYGSGEVAPYPLISSAADFDSDLRTFFSGDRTREKYINTLFPEVAWPMLHSHRSFKAKDISTALVHLIHCKATDWKLACEEWLKRRLK